MAHAKAKRDLPYSAPLHTRAQDAVGDYFKSKLDAELPRQVTCAIANSKLCAEESKQ